MQRSDFHYDLPAELIAQVPLAERRASRLLVLDGATRRARGSRVRRAAAAAARRRSARLQRHARAAGARRRPQADGRARRDACSSGCSGPRRALVHLRASHKPQPGGEIELPGGARARVVARAGELTEIELDRDVVPFLEAHGADAAAALHRAHAGRRRSRALPNGVRARAGRRGRADGGPALRRCACSTRSRRAASSARF